MPNKSILNPDLTAFSNSPGCRAMSMRAWAIKRFFILRFKIRSQISSDLLGSVKKLSSLNSMALAVIYVPSSFSFDRVDLS